MRLTAFLDPSRIKVPLEGTTRDECIQELLALIPLPEDRCRQEVFQTVLDREKLMTTGIGSGIAIPHGSTEFDGSLVGALGLPGNPVDWQSIDGHPVEMVFLLVANKAKPGENIKALARISRLLHRDAFRNDLVSAGSASKAYQVIEEEESRHKI